MAEYRISIYGRSVDEWDALAKWVINNKMYSNNVRWLIQVPRLYHVYKAAGDAKNFEEMLVSILLRVAPIPHSSEQYCFPALLLPIDLMSFTLENVCSLIRHLCLFLSHL
jgi:adenosine deaminase